MQVRAVNKIQSGRWSGTQSATNGDNAIAAVSGCNWPSLLGRQLVWNGVLTVGEKLVPSVGNQPDERVGWGYYERVGAISERNTPTLLGDNSYTIGDMLMQFDIPETLAPLIVPPTGALVLNLSADLTAAETENLVLHVCDQDSTSRTRRDPGATTKSTRRRHRPPGTSTTTGPTTASRGRRDWPG